jgi:hypothetical protein
MTSTGQTIIINTSDMQYEIILNENTLIINAKHITTTDYKNWHCEIKDRLASSKLNCPLKINYSHKEFFYFFWIKFLVKICIQQTLAIFYCNNFIEKYWQYIDFFMMRWSGNFTNNYQ